MKKPAKVAVTAIKTCHKQVVQGKIGEKEILIAQEREREVLLVNFYEKAKNSAHKCFMLSFNKPDGRCYSLNDIIATLLKQKMLSDVLQPLDNTILFLSSENLVPIQKKLRELFPTFEFVLVRINQGAYPKSSVKYVNKLIPFK